MSYFPANVPSLPLDNAPNDPESEDFRIDFRRGDVWVKAFVYDERDLICDIVLGRTFEEAYDNVRNEYPQAKWVNPNA